jgi:hypothetical protein
MTAISIRPIIFPFSFIEAEIGKIVLGVDDKLRCYNYVDENRRWNDYYFIFIFLLMMDFLMAAIVPTNHQCV